jgi:hypothetical protein
LGVSFDLFAQLFVNGEASPVRVPEVLDVLRPFVIVGPEEDGFCRTHTADGGEADFYFGNGTGGFMVNSRTLAHQRQPWPPRETVRGRSAEFRRDAAEGLRQPLEDWRVVVTRMVGVALRARRRAVC